MENESVDITPKDSVTPVYLVERSPQEEIEHSEWLVEHEKFLEEEQAKVAAKESALAKLAKLGLTEEEARAVIGI